MLADAAELARSAISALQCMACCPCDGLADVVAPFPLEASLSGAQPAESARSGQHGHSKAVDICCQVCDSLHSLIGNALKYTLCKLPGQQVFKDTSQVR